MRLWGITLLVLGIETSCDDTGAAVFDTERGLRSHALASQVDIHAPYGGVVPELAARDHVRVLMPLVHQVLKTAAVPGCDINGIAYTAGPGLTGALLVGAALGRALAWAWQVPALGVHHMEGHLLAPMLEDEPPTFPFVALLVSGGHTLLVDVLGVGRYRLLGSTLDDAVGEAFDKTAKILGLGYPGGPALAKLANKGLEGRFNFPRPMTDRPGLDFSFSGLKTFARNTYINFPKEKANIAKAFEVAATETLTIKCRRALEKTGLKTLVVAGGVSANISLRSTLSAMAKKLDVDVFYPAHEFCTDNGAMIALAGHFRFLSGQRNDHYDISIKPRWSLEELQPV